MFNKSIKTKNCFVVYFSCNIFFFFTAKHSLEYFCTAASGVKEFPEFVGVATVDKDFVGSCSMIIHRKEPKQTVIKKFFEENSKEMRMYFLECQDNERFYASKHVLQQHSGCEWDDETGETKSFNRYAYDGDDFLKLDLLKHEWTALTEKALATKLTWENNKVCPVRLRKYMTVGREYLQRTGTLRSFHFSCHATGFFPDMVDLFWMKDGEEFHEDVEKGEILPHNDETFQMRKRGPTRGVVNMARPGSATVGNLAGPSTQEQGPEPTPQGHEHPRLRCNVNPPTARKEHRRAQEAGVGTGCSRVAVCSRGPSGSFDQ
uniref:MHC class I-like antigen recognition-like domain-containing protein n=1 Tax=Oryzias latipes TaxID=8090 RepID=A0A3P9JQ39_ORYLA